MQQSLRTQIYLPRDLRREIDKQRAQTGESLAGYLRRAAEEKVKKDKKGHIDLRKLAEEFIGCSKKTDQEIQDWLDWVREERRLSDEAREKRLEKAINKG